MEREVSTWGRACSLDLSPVLLLWFLSFLLWYPNFLSPHHSLSLSLSRTPLPEISEWRLIVWLHHWKQERASGLKSLCVCVCVFTGVCVCVRRVQVCSAESTITISLSFLWAGMPCMLDNDWRRGGEGGKASEEALYLFALHRATVM